MTNPNALTVTVAEAAELLGISKQTAYRYVSERDELVPGVPVLRIGPRLTRVSRAAIESYLAGGQRVERAS